MKRTFQYSFAWYVEILMIFSIMMGCAHDQEGKAPPADVLYKEAQQFATDGKVEKASEAFMKVRTFYPGNDLAKQSLLDLSDLYYNNKEYVSALSSYQEFRMLYPTDAKSEYCMFKAAMCHFKQILTIDRDQTETVKSIKSFEDFLRMYPDSTYSNEANENLKKSKIVLAKNGIYIGKFYMHRKKWHEAACRRFTEVKAGFPGLGLDEELDKLIKESCGTKE
ncbi:MAG TPA: outer membrane protein assembly factor BamD [Desulfomonilia bacterium]